MASVDCGRQPIGGGSVELVLNWQNFLTVSICYYLVAAKIKVKFRKTKHGQNKMKQKQKCETIKNTYVLIATKVLGFGEVNKEWPTPGTWQESKSQDAEHQVTETPAVGP